MGKRSGAFVLENIRFLDRASAPAAEADCDNFTGFAPTKIHFNADQP